MAKKKKKAKPKKADRIQQFKNQVKAMSSDQLRQRKQHLEEEKEWFKYQNKTAQRGVEYLDTSLKYELWQKKKEKEELEKDIKESVNPAETEFLRSKLWFVNLELEEGLNLKATRKRKELMAQTYQYNQKITNINAQLGIITDRLTELDKKLSKKK